MASSFVFPMSPANLREPRCFLFDPAEIPETVHREVTGSALFAARFRECAARALLLGGHRPGKRAPLWQQRHRAARLLEIAAGYEDFPIVVEASRECLNDVYDLPTLVDVCRKLGSGSIRLHHITTERPSPFAQSMLFSSVGEFLYQGDLPLGERRVAALSLDLDLMEQLLGPGALNEVMDPAVAADVEAELQRTAPGWQKFGTEGIVDLLRELGPLTEEEVAARLGQSIRRGIGRRRPHGSGRRPNRNRGLRGAASRSSRKEWAASHCAPSWQWAQSSLEAAGSSFPLNRRTPERWRAWTGSSP